jgi:hypothetical protein
MTYDTHNGLKPWKTCPGNLLDDKWLAELLKRPVAVSIPPKPIERTCVAQETLITQQNAQIGRLQALVQSLLMQIRRIFART